MTELLVEERVPEAREQAGLTDRTASRRVAIIDIGSNSVRLVVYDGPPRIPFVLFNEKVLAGLGAGLGQDGRIDEAGFERGMAALKRFARLRCDRRGARRRQRAGLRRRRARAWPRRPRPVGPRGRACLGLWPVVGHARR
jgi:hypothetical protein